MVDQKATNEQLGMVAHMLGLVDVKPYDILPNFSNYFNFCIRFLTIS